MQQLRFQRSGRGDLFELGEMRQRPDGVAGSMTLGRWATGPDGSASVGALGVLADEVLGYALMASLPQDAWSISTEIWLDVVGELPAAGESLIGHAVPVEVAPSRPASCGTCRGSGDAAGAARRPRRLAARVQP